MKNFILLLSFTTLISCSDSLTENKVETIIEKCLENNPIAKDTTFYFGSITVFKNSKRSAIKINTFKKLEAVGFVSIKVKSKNNQRTKYFITPTEKFTKIILKQNKNFKASNSRRTSAKIKLYEYELNEVSEIHEIPSANSAKVKLSFAPLNYTEIAKALSSVGKIKVKQKVFKKTNNGWATGCNNRKINFPLF